MSCSASKSTQVKPIESSIEDFATKHFENARYATLGNADGSYSIVYSKYKNLEDLMANVRFFVFEEATQTIILEDSLSQGTVNWSSDFEIMVIARQVKTAEGGVIAKQTYYYDVKKKKKRME